ncbi:MAG: Ger(x)C family spore germination protein [Peptococcaceae bacterium]
MPAGKDKLTFFMIIVMLGGSLLAGCWDRKEINSIGFAVGLGIDKDGESYQVTTQLALPSMLVGDSGGPEAPVWVVGGQGRTIFEAIRDVNTRSARKPFWGHLNVIVIGEEVAKEGIIPVLDLLSRGQELRRSNYIVVAKGKGRDILEAEPKLESINAIFISSLIENRTGQSVAPAVTLNDLLVCLSTAGTECVLPQIAALEQESYLPPKEAAEPAAGPEEGAEKPKQILELRGGGIFKGDKLVEWMDEETTRGYLWAKGQVKGGIIVVENPLQPGSNISLEIKKNAGEIATNFNNVPHEITINVTAAFNLVENSGIVGLEEAGRIDELNKRAAEAVRKEITKAIVLAQDNKADIFGIGEQVKARHPQIWKQVKWSEIFPNLEIKVNVEAETQEAAMTINPISPPSQRSK